MPDDGSTGRTVAYTITLADGGRHRPVYHQ
jgi:hypothetical protein